MSETDRPRYDPYTTQPRTLGELESYARAAERAGSQAMARSPVALDEAAVPGLGRLTACIAAEETKLTPGAVRRISGRYRLARGVTVQQAKEASLQEVADVVAPRPDHPPAARSEQAGTGRDRLEPPDATAPPEQTDPVSRVIALMLTWEREGREYTVEGLATAVGTSKATLYRDKQFKAVRREMRAANAPPKGRIDDEGNVEAQAP
jgi:hypothetical protein